jgi:hypothetical protein
MGPVDFHDHWSGGSLWMNWVFAWINRNDKRDIREGEVCGWWHYKGEISVLAASSGRLLFHGKRVELFV